MNPLLIRFQDGFLLERLLGKEVKEFDKNLIQEFIKEVKKHEQELMKEIENYTGKKWIIKELDVFLVQRPLRSFSSPLVISVSDKGVYRLLLTLVHELIHVNITQDKTLDKTIVRGRLSPPTSFRDVHDGIEYGAHIIVEKVFPHIIDRIKKCFFSRRVSEG